MLWIKLTNLTLGNHPVMNKSLAVVLFTVFFNIPSLVFAEAKWYGQLGVGIASEPSVGGGSSTGVDSVSSRWGIKGWNRVSEGLFAVYRFETEIDSTDASEPEGRLSFVGLRGGFGMILLGKIGSASYRTVGTIIDKSLVYGQRETTYFVGNAVSYTIKIDNLHLQADAVMDKDTEKTSDSFQIGAKVEGLMDTGSIAFAHYSHADKAVVITALVNNVRRNFPSGTQKTKSSYIVGEYGIGNMKMYLGAGKHSAKNDDCSSNPLLASFCSKKGTVTSTYAGIRGGMGDTGFNYNFQMVKKKIKSTNNASSPVTTRSSTTPWLLGISRGLGGGASLHFETSNPDENGQSSSTGVWLKVEF